jgi:Cd(II)/Pb(II)-responsive transcriptional regulator
MKIGELAAATDTGVETIRFYEREGLLPAPARSASNYRHYEAGHVQRLQFIRRCRSLDMALDEIRALLALAARPQAGCEAVNALLDEHIQHVASRIRELHALEGELRELRAHCRVGQGGATGAGDCGILQALHQAAPTPAPSRTSTRTSATPLPSARREGHVGAVHGPRQRAAGQRQEAGSGQGRQPRRHQG